MCLVRNKQLLGTIKKGSRPGSPPEKSGGGRSPPANSQPPEEADADAAPSETPDVDDDIEELIDGSGCNSSDGTIDEDCSEEVSDVSAECVPSAAAGVVGELMMLSEENGVDLSEATAAVVAAATELLIHESPPATDDVAGRCLVPAIIGGSTLAAARRGPPPWVEGGPRRNNGYSVRTWRSSSSRDRRRSSTDPYPRDPREQPRIHSGATAHREPEDDDILEEETPEQRNRQQQRNNSWAALGDRSLPPDRPEDGSGGSGDGDSEVEDAGGGGGGRNVGPMVEMFWRLKFKNRPIRAGVIRNLRNPGRPLAFYFLPT